jgi:hypothetical protein
VYAARIRGERRVRLDVKVRPATSDALRELLAGRVVPETTVSQLLRRWIAEGIARDRAGV